MKFKLDQTHRVGFIAKEDQGNELTANAVGTKEDQNVWNSQLMHVFWHVRWTAKGLMPVKPAIHLLEALDLPAGRSCHLTAVDALQ